MKAELTADRAALMGEDSIIQVSCCICGQPATNKHHAVPRSAGGEGGPRVSVCGMGNTSGCHRLAHGHGLRFAPHHRFECSEDAAKDISKRRKRSGLRAIKGGSYPLLVVPTDANAMAELAEIEQSIKESRAYSKASSYYLGRDINKLSKFIPDDRSITEHVRELLDLQINAAQISKLRKWATLPEEPAFMLLGVTLGYEMGRAYAPENADAFRAAAERLADPTDGYNAETLRAELFGAVPKRELPTRECPIGAGLCSRTIKEGNHERA